MNWFDRFRIAAFIGSLSLLATVCVSIEATYILLLGLLGALGVYVIQNELREIILRQLEIRKERGAQRDARLDRTIAECRETLKE